MRNKKIPRQNVRAIAARLNRGSYKIIAEEFGFTYDYVAKIMTGDRQNKKVVFRALELVKEQEEEHKKEVELLEI